MEGMGVRVVLPTQVFNGDRLMERREKYDKEAQIIGRKTAKVVKDNKEILLEL